MTLVDQLSKYATYHRDQRNIATHFVGVPMIVLAVIVLLSRPLGVVSGVALSLAPFAMLAAAIFYLRLELRMGLTMAALLALQLPLGARLASGSVGLWLGAGLGLFVVGWVIQFVGHYFEGRKPAFVDDLVGLLIGPLFVVAEWAFLLGMRHELREQIEGRAGPIRSVRGWAPSATRASR